MFDLAGNELNSIQFDGTRAEYTKTEMMNHPTLGNPMQMEPESITLDGDRLLVLMTDVWRTGSPIVTWQGGNWVSVLDANVGHLPDNPTYWAPTTKAATDGAWDAATTYGWGSNYTRRGKYVYAIAARQVGSALERPLNHGVRDVNPAVSNLSARSSVDAAYHIWRGVCVKAFSPG